MDNRKFRPLYPSVDSFPCASVEHFVCQVKYISHFVSMRVKSSWLQTRVRASVTLPLCPWEQPESCKAAEDERHCLRGWSYSPEFAARRCEAERAETRRRRMDAAKPGGHLKWLYCHCRRIWEGGWQQAKWGTDKETEIERQGVEFTLRCLNVTK